MTDTLSAVAARLLDPLIGREGGYVDHPQDKGGPTIWGITEMVARRAGYSGDMPSMSRSAAMDIYWKQYVLGPGIDQLAQRSLPLAAEALDTGVNMGPSKGVEFLQVALNAFNLIAVGQPELWPTLARLDGDYGGKTDGALAAYLAHPKRGRVDVLLAAMNSQQGDRYLDIVGRDPTQRVFAFGWFANRIVAAA
jgi:lysozyme family protein